MSDAEDPDDYTIGEVSITRRITAEGREFVAWTFDPPDMSEVELLGLIGCGRMQIERAIAEAHR